MIQKKGFDVNELQSQDLIQQDEEYMPNFKHLSRPAQFICITAPLYKNANENQIHLLQRASPQSLKPAGFRTELHTLYGHVKS